MIPDFFFWSFRLVNRTPSGKKKCGMLPQAWDGGKEVECVSRGLAQVTLPGGITYSVFTCNCQEDSETSIST